MKNLYQILAMLAIVSAASLAYAAYPMISQIPNQYINMNESTPVLSFFVTDDVTSPEELKIGYSSNNTNLVPEDDDHIIIRGRGSDKTIRVIPIKGRSGVVTIEVTATDNDGNTYDEEFEIEVQRGPW